MAENDRMTAEIKRPGHIRKAPENFLDPQLLREINEQGLDEKRRRFLRQSFLMASAGSAATSASMSFALKALKTQQRAIRIFSYCRHIRQRWASR
jgi:hypothetical protein